MKKHFLLLPLVSIITVACSSGTTAPIDDVNGTLSPGVLQPVNSSQSNAGWEPQIQPQTMPVEMTTPNVNLPSVNTPNVNLPSVNTQQVQQAVNQASQQVQTQVNSAVQQVNQNFNIPRHPTTNAPDYSKISKGFYTGSTYTVRPGDTMFLVSYISGMEVKELARINGLNEPYALKVGQVLNIANPNAASVATQSSNAQPPVIYTPTATNTSQSTPNSASGTVSGPVKASVGTLPKANPPATTVTTPPTISAKPAISSGINWSWPTKGNIVQGFSNTDGGNKGIDIAGSRGQAIYAAAPGQVVYAGNALRGYGNLIIIKHNDDFLSAYAHNETMLVKDQQQVNAGQQIAKMGSSGANSVKLHFEIRYKGKSVNPIDYLPRK